MQKMLILTTILSTSFFNAAQARPHLHHSSQAGVVKFLPHPAGCPRTLFCGCGARKSLGISDVRLNLASNWTRFYHGITQVAVWPGHVAIIRQNFNDGTALLEDYNSGGHLSRLWRQPLRGAKIVGGFMQEGKAQ